MATIQQGYRIKHPSYGEGVVQDNIPDIADEQLNRSIAVYFPKAGIKTLNYSYALEHCTVIAPKDEKFQKNDKIRHLNFGIGIVTDKKNKRQPVPVKDGYQEMLVRQIKVAFEGGKRITFIYNEDFEKDAVFTTMEVERHQCGDRVIHPDYGKGTVASKETLPDPDDPSSNERWITVHFDSGEQLTFLYNRETEDLLKKIRSAEGAAKPAEEENENDVKVSSQGDNEKGESGDTEEGSGVSEEKNVRSKCYTYRRMPKVMSRFSRFSLDERNLREIEDFFIFKLNYESGHNKAVRYNLLIQCENDSVAVELINEIVNGLKDLYLDTYNVRIDTELNFIDLFSIDSRVDDRHAEEALNRAIDSSSLYAVHDCRRATKDAAHMSSFMRDEIQKTRQRKDRAWHRLMTAGNLSPDCTVIAAGPKDFIDYIRENDDLFYRFFAHHITVRQMTADEIIAGVYCGIDDEDLKVTEGFKASIEEYIRDVYPKADLRDTVFVDDLLNRIFVKYHLYPCDELTEEYVPFHRKPRSFEEISGELNGLIGLKKVKKQFDMLNKLAQDPQSVNKTRLHFSFVGNPGTGKTTVANLTADLLYSMGLIKRNKLVSVAPQDIIGQYLGHSVYMMSQKIEEAIGGVLFIDEAYFLMSDPTDTHSYHKQCLDVLLQAIENRSDELTVIFAGYPEEIERFLRSNPGLKSRVPYKFVFEDYSKEELLKIFEDLAKKEEIALAEDAREALVRKIELEMSEENFGNARTVANIYQQIKAVWLEQNRAERIFTAEDVEKTLPAVSDEALDEIFGLKGIKNKLLDFQSRVRYVRYIEEKKMKIPPFNLHMMFTGSPGTGKSTVAGMIADILYHAGVLTTNKLVKAERKDLVGQHVGQTALKTEKLIKKAMNGVLFIDEAYTLYRYGESGDFGIEAIETLITAMEEYKGQLVVIFAGYRNEMRRFLSANPGIFSRIGFTFDFPDYKPSELKEMFCGKMGKMGFEVEEAAKKKVLKIMEYFFHLEDFGNARFVDKVINITINNRSHRDYKRRYNDISAKDIPEIRDLLNTTPYGPYLVTDEERSKLAKRRTAIHEAGHAVVAKVLDPKGEITVVSINADAGGRLGATSFKRRRENDTEKTLKAYLATLFGGRNAERLIFGEHSTGCVEDINTAKDMAAFMINNVAMGELGVTTEMELLQEADRKATEVLSENKEKLIRLADKLCKSKNGSVSGKALKTLL